MSEPISASDMRDMYVDIYIGKGVKDPPITYRLSILENRMDRSEDLQKSTDRKFWAIIILLLTSLAGLIVDMAKHH